MITRKAKLTVAAVAIGTALAAVGFFVGYQTAAPAVDEPVSVSTDYRYEIENAQANRLRYIHADLERSYQDIGWCWIRRYGKDGGVRPHRVRLSMPAMQTDDSYVDQMIMRRAAVESQEQFFAVELPKIARGDYK